MSQVMESIRSAGAVTKEKSMEILDNQIPPQRRSELAEAISSWAKGNPKLAAFIASHLALSSIPVLLFLLFTTTTLIATTTTLLILATLSALAFTAFCAGAAVLLLIPTLFITSIIATFVFFWGLAGYLVLQWYNGGEPPELRVPSGREVSEKVNHATDGRLELLTAKKEERAKAVEALRAERHESSLSGGGGPGGGLFKPETNYT